MPFSRASERTAGLPEREGHKFGRRNSSSSLGEQTAGIMPRMPEAFRLHFEIQYVGKTIKASKRRITWKFAFAGDQDEHSVVLVHTINSGKKVVFLNGNQIHEDDKVCFGAHTPAGTANVCGSRSRRVVPAVTSYFACCSVSYFACWVAVHQPTPPARPILVAEPPLAAPSVC